MAALRTVSLRTTPRLVTEFSLYHPGHHRWVTVAADRTIRFDSVEPLPLKRFFPSPDAGTEPFAARMLEWVRAGAGGRVVAPQDAHTAFVFAYERETTEEPDSGLRFRPLRRNAGLWTSFEVRGLPDRVSDWCRYYETIYPPSIFKTRFFGQPSSPGLKIVNIVRLKDEGETAPPIDAGEGWQPLLRDIG